MIRVGGLGDVNYQGRSEGKELVYQGDGRESVDEGSGERERSSGKEGRGTVHERLSWTNR